MKFKATKMMQTAQGRQLLDISFELEPGRLLTLFGPSGAGKTTILRILAGLTDTTSAAHDRSGWRRPGIDYHPQDPPVLPAAGPIGFVFQDFALFPHLTVRQQLEFALRKTQTDKAIIPDLLAP